MGIEKGKSARESRAHQPRELTILDRLQNGIVPQVEILQREKTAQPLPPQLAPQAIRDLFEVSAFQKQLQEVQRRGAEDPVVTAEGEWERSMKLLENRKTLFSSVEKIKDGLEDTFTSIYTSGEGGQDEKVEIGYLSSNERASSAEVVFPKNTSTVYKVKAEIDYSDEGNYQTFTAFGYENSAGEPCVEVSLKTTTRGVIKPNKTG